MSKLSVSSDSSMKFSDVYNSPDKAKMKKPGKNPSGAFGNGNGNLSPDKNACDDGFIFTHMKPGNIALRLNTGEPLSSKAMDKLVQDLAMVREII